MQVEKYGLEFDPDNVVSETTVEMPKGAEILTVGLAHNGVALLALVDPDAEVEERTFIMVGNHVPLPEGVSALHFREAIKLPNVSLSIFETTGVPATA